MSSEDTLTKLARCNPEGVKALRDDYRSKGNHREADAVTRALRAAGEYDGTPAPGYPGLFEHTRRDDVGRKITTYSGDPGSWLRLYQRPGVSCSLDKEFLNEARIGGRAELRFVPTRRKA